MYSNVFKFYNMLSHNYFILKIDKKNTILPILSKKNFKIFEIFEIFIISKLIVKNKKKVNYCKISILIV